MGSPLKIIRQIEKVFDPYLMMFKDGEGGGGNKNKELQIERFCKENKTLEVY
jgi:hypothetical protein